MNQPRLQELPYSPEITEETPEIPANLPRSALRSRLQFGMENLADNPRAVVAAWLAPLSPPSLGVGDA